MTTSTYQGRHRSASDGPKAPTVPGAGGRHRRPGGRSLPRLAGTGVLLPTVATAAVVLTTTGAHLGAATSPSPSGDTLAAARTVGAADAAARQQAVQTAASSLAAQSRSLTDRAARDAARADVADRAATAKATAEATRAAAAKAAADRAAKAAAAAHRWVAPLAVPFTLTSGFGMRWGSMHPGQDFAVPVGSPVMAMSSGTVLFAGWEGGYGNKVEIRYWDGTISWYAHNSRLQVAQGDTVTPGEVVALSGNTGHSTGPHSHVEIHLGGDDTQNGAVPPIPWLTQHGAMPGRGSAGASTAGD